MRNMNKIIQNMKLGFDNIKELIGIFIDDESSNPEGYDTYMNSSNTELAQTAMLLQSLEYEQEEKRFSLFKTKEAKKHQVKKNYKTIEPPSITEESSKRKNDIQLNELEPDK